MVSFHWIYYELELSPLRVAFRQKLTIFGPRLNSSIAERCGREYAKDLRNKIIITGKMPLLQVCYTDSITFVSCLYLLIISL